jgi:hypothetical protein
MKAWLGREEHDDGCDDEQEADSTEQHGQEPAAASDHHLPALTLVQERIAQSPHVQPKPEPTNCTDRGNSGPTRSNNGRDH